MKNKMCVWIDGSKAVVVNLANNSIIKVDAAIDNNVHHGHEGDKGTFIGGGRHLNNERTYQAYSIGIMTRNENLVSSTFQISFGIYPFLPNGDNNVFLFNPVTSFTLRVRGFSMGRPEFISY